MVKKPQDNHGQSTADAKSLKQQAEPPEVGNILSVALLQQTIINLQTELKEIQKNLKDQEDAIKYLLHHSKPFQNEIQQEKKNEKQTTRKTT